MRFLRCEKPFIDLGGNWWTRFLDFIISRAFPKAYIEIQKNVAIDDKIKYFLLEFTDDNSEPDREIGLSEAGVPLYFTSAVEKKKSSGPFGIKNGFSDSAMKIKDFFEEFNCTEISAAEFESEWERSQRSTR